MLNHVIIGNKKSISKLSQFFYRHQNRYLNFESQDYIGTYILCAHTETKGMCITFSCLIKYYSLVGINTNTCCAHELVTISETFSSVRVHTRNTHAPHHNNALAQDAPNITMLHAPHPLCDNTHQLLVSPAVARMSNRSHCGVKKPNMNLTQEGQSGLIEKFNMAKGEAAGGSGGGWCLPRGGWSCG